MPEQPILMIYDEAEGPDLYEQTEELLAIDQAELHAIPSGFYPDTEDKIEWVLEQINDTRAAIKRIKENSADRVKAKEKRLDYFLAAYTEPLRLWAKDNLPKRSQTVPLDNGKLSFTKVSRQIKIEGDDAAAVALAEQIAPDLIKIVPEQRTVNRAELARRMQIVEQGEGASETEPGFLSYRVVNPSTGEKIEFDAVVITEATERFTIK